MVRSLVYMLFGVTFACQSVSASELSPPERLPAPEGVNASKDCVCKKDARDSKNRQTPAASNPASKETAESGKSILKAQKGKRKWQGVRRRNSAAATTLASSMSAALYVYVPSGAEVFFAIVIDGKSQELPSRNNEPWKRHRSYQFTNVPAGGVEVEVIVRWPLRGGQQQQVETTRGKCLDCTTKWACCSKKIVLRSGDIRYIDDWITKSRDQQNEVIDLSYRSRLLPPHSNGNGKGKKIPPEKGKQQPIAI